MKPEQQDVEMYSVELRDPVEVRRHILESLKSILEILQGFEKFKQIKHEKIEKIQKLRVLLKDANKVMGALKLKLPQTNLRAIVGREAPRKTEEMTQGKKPSAKPEQKTQKKDKNEFERLQDELNALESKLKNLS